MRSDYALYTVALIFFILTAIVLAYQVELKELWTVTTAILGIFFIGLGYILRPKPQQMQIEVPQRATIPPPMPTPVVAEVAKEEKIEVPPAVVAPSPMQLTAVKGIKEKRSEQLKALGINNVQELANASATDLATKLKISPKITEKWIEYAKTLLEKS
jgi:predicted flap endonuclease-1-like 5' DNA nuclease